MVSKVFKLRKYKTVIVYSNPPLLPIIAVIAKKLFRVDIVFVAYDIYPEVAILLGATTKGSIIDKVTNKVNEMLYKNTTKVVALSSEMKEYLIEHKPYVTGEKVEVISNWYMDKPELKETTIHNQRFKEIKDSGKTIILYSGNMGMAQDMKTVMDSIRLLKDEKNIHFMLVGHGCKLDKLREEAKRERLSNVEFYEFLHKTDFTDVLKIADAYIISLEKGVESLSVPSKTYSYMAVGRPLLAIMSEETDIARDINNSHIGFVIEQGNSDKMAECIRKLNTNKDLIVDMGYKCRKVYEQKYTDKICIGKYIKMIKQL